MYGSGDEVLLVAGDADEAGVRLGQVAQDAPEQPQPGAEHGHDEGWDGAKRVPVVGPSGVSISIASTSMSRLASYTRIPRTGRPWRGGTRPDPCPSRGKAGQQLGGEGVVDLSDEHGRMMSLRSQDLRGPKSPDQATGPVRDELRHDEDGGEQGCQCDDCGRRHVLQRHALGDESPADSPPGGDAHRGPHQQAEDEHRRALDVDHDPVCPNG